MPHNPIINPEYNLSDGSMAPQRYINPTQERYDGDNNAYRGTEAHGVETDRHTEAIDDDNVAIEREEYKDGVPPVHARQPEPVTVTIRRKRIKNGSSHMPIAANETIMALPKDPKRTRAIVAARNAAMNCRIVPPDSSLFIGFTVPSMRGTPGTVTGPYLELFTTDPVYIRNGGTADTIEIYYEYEDEDYDYPEQDTGGW